MSAFVIVFYRTIINNNICIRNLFSLSVPLGENSHTWRSSDVKDSMDDILKDMISEVIFETALCNHRAVKLGIFDQYDVLDASYKANSSKSPDFQLPQVDKKSALATMVLCPHCRKKQAATRLSSHLSKCLGFGRNSSRQASRRIAQISLEEEFGEEEFEGYASNEDSSGGTGEVDSLGSTCSPEAPLLTVNEEDEDTDEMEAGDAGLGEEEDDDLDDEWEASSSASSYTSGLNGVA